MTRFQTGTVRASRYEKLMHLAEKIVLQFGEPNNFDAQQWLSEWIDQQCPALNNVKPIELLDSDEGALEVEKVLWRMVTGATA